MTERTKLLIGEDNVKKLQNSHVAVFGIGGVGGYTAEMLVRAGVGTITLVDFDKVDKTNLNRQIIALNSTIGKKKVEVMKTRLLDINSDLNITVFDEKYTQENSEMFFENKYDYVVDAIDMVKSKLHLIKTCHEKDINIVSAMGAGNRYTIPEFRVADINKTYNDGLAKVVRKNLRDMGITQHNVVFTEDLAKTKSDTIGSISYYPAMCGCTISAFVVNELIN